MGHSFAVLLYAIYIPPASNLHLYESIFESFESKGFFNENLLIIGDFNIPELHLLNESTSEQFLPSIMRRLANFTSFFGLTQINNVKNAHNRILDAIFFNRDALVERCYPLVVPEDAHHPAIECTLMMPKVKHSKNVPNDAHYNFKRADFLNLYYEIRDTDWNSLNCFTDLDAAVDKFYDLLYKAIDQYVPKTKKCNKYFPPWYTYELITDIKTKARLHKKMKQQNSEVLKEQFNILRTKLKKEQDVAYKSYLNDIEKSIIHEPANFWKYFKNKKNTRSLLNNMKVNNTPLEKYTGCGRCLCQ